MTKKCKSLVIAIALVIGAGVFSAAGADSASAAVQKPGKVSLVSVKSCGTTAVTLKWKKVKGAKGYQIFQNGKAIKRVGAKKLSFKKTGLQERTKYSYKVRAYTTYKKKKSPKKNYYRYGAFSAVKSCKCLADMTKN